MDCTKICRESEKEEYKQKNGANVKLKLQVMLCIKRESVCVLCGSGGV